MAEQLIQTAPPLQDVIDRLEEGARLAEDAARAYPLAAPELTAVSLWLLSVVQHHLQPWQAVLRVEEGVSHG